MDEKTQNFSQNEALKKQLMNNSMINELMKVAHSFSNPNEMLKTILLGIKDLLSFQRIIFYTIDKENLVLKPETYIGIDSELPEEINNIPIGFEGGDITDAVFLNRHIIVDEAPEDIDLFRRHLGSTKYLVFPLTGIQTGNCWKKKECPNPKCPAHNEFSAYCWSIDGTCPPPDPEMGKRTENEKRMVCIKCEAFQSLGVLWMDSKSEGDIDNDDITMLSSILNQTGMILDNLYMYGKLDKANSQLSETNQKLKTVNTNLKIAQSKINRDLDHAKNIQEGLLPKNVSELTEKCNVHAFYTPADAVGGHYYDFFRIDDDNFGIIVADVSGHGVASALIMSMVKVLLKSFSNEYKTSPSKTLNKINELFQKEVASENFVTVFYAVINTREKKILHTSAGHCPVLFVNRTTKEVSKIEADGLFLGIFEEMMLKDNEISYKPGEYRLVLFTDGITEAKNTDDEMYEINRLSEAVIESLSKEPEEAVEYILEDQREFCKDAPPHEDDITLLILDV